MVGSDFAPALLIALVLGVDRRNFRPSLREHLVLAGKLFVDPRQLGIERARNRLGAVGELVPLQFLLALGQVGNVGFSRFELAFDSQKRPAAREVDLFFAGIGVRQGNVPPRLLFLSLGELTQALVFGFLGFDLRRRQRRIDFLDLPPLLVEYRAALVDRIRRHLVAVVNDALVVGPFVHSGCHRRKRAQGEPRRETRCGAPCKRLFIDHMHRSGPCAVPVLLQGIVTLTRRIAPGMP